MKTTAQALSRLPVPLEACLLRQSFFVHTQTSRNTRGSRRWKQNSDPNGFRDRDGLAPVALAREDPVAQLVRDLRAALVAERGDHGALTLLRREPVELPALHGYLRQAFARAATQRYGAPGRARKSQSFFPKYLASLKCARCFIQMARAASSVSRLRATQEDKPEACQAVFSRCATPADARAGEGLLEDRVRRPVRPGRADDLRRPPAAGRTRRSRRGAWHLGRLEDNGEGDRAAKQSTQGERVAPGVKYCLLNLMCKAGNGYFPPAF